jgi:hypothetical protein
VFQNAKFWHTLLSSVRVSRVQGAEIEDEEGVLKYMTKSEIEKQRSCLLVVTHRYRVIERNDITPFIKTIRTKVVLMPSETQLILYSDSYFFRHYTI